MTAEQIDAHVDWLFLTRKPLAFYWHDFGNGCGVFEYLPMMQNG